MTFIDHPYIQLSADEIHSILSLALGNGGDFADLYFEKQNLLSVTLNENKIKSINQELITGVGLRVVKGEKTAYLYSNSLNYDSLKTLAEHCKENFCDNKLVLNSEFQNIQPFSVINHPIRTINDHIAHLKHFNDYCRINNKVKQVSITYFISDRMITLINSDLKVFNRHSHRESFSNSIIYSHLGNRESAYSNWTNLKSGQSISESEIENCADESIRLAKVRIKAKKISGGEKKLLLHKGWGAVLVHEAVGHGLEADFIRKGSSLYCNQINKTVASPLVTITDDPTLSNERASYLFDDEGEKAEKKILIENGQLKAYLFDKQNAALMKQKSNGSGRREDFRSTPMPRMSNTYLANGKSEPEDLLLSIKDGIFAKKLAGGQVNISNGNFVFELSEAYKVENGKIMYPIKDATLIGNGPDIMKKVVGLANDLYIEPHQGVCGKNGQTIKVSVGQPTVLIDKITVGAD